MLRKMTTSDRDGSSAAAVPSEPWAMHAARWKRLGPPLRPRAEDLQRLHETWRRSLPASPPRSIDLLSLGVTPEIALFPWTEAVRVQAIDASEEMIRTVWPGDTSQRQAVLGNWLQTPFADASFDLIVCDAGLVQLVGRESVTRLGGELLRLLKENGRVVMRHFSRPVPAETERSIHAAVEAGQMPGFHELKLRLLMALEARTPQRGVRLGDTWNCFAQLFPDRASLARELACDVETIATIDTYRDRDARYSFLSLEELAEAFAGFHLALGPAGHYPFAECCPVFSLTPIR
jgi:SAM-dependent methyltransferase